RRADRPLPTVRGADHLPLLPAARVPPGRARAGARDQGDGGAACAARHALPGLPSPCRAHLPRVPRMHDSAEAVLCLVWPAARGALAGVPVLRRGCTSRAARARRHPELVTLESADVRERLARLRRRMARETTLVLVKPDGMRRGLAGEIIARFERRGLELRGARLLRVSKAMGRKHYAEHKGKPFFAGLVDFISSGPVLALAVNGESAISVVRTMMGATNPLDSAPGTIRGDFALELSENIVHGSDSKASARRELALFFPDGLV